MSPLMTQVSHVARTAVKSIDRSVSHGTNAQESDVA